MGYSAECRTRPGRNMTFQIHRRKNRAKPLFCAILAASALFSACREKQTLPRPEFPLSEAALTAALEETGLSWSIEQADENTKGTETSITYSLHRPENKAAYSSVFINSYESEEFGRRLQILFHEPQNKQWWQEEEKDACWEDWRETLVLAARLYGGFEDAEEIYRTCSAAELPPDRRILWQGTIAGKYFRMETAKPMKPERFSMGNTLSFNVYESEEAYLRFVQMAEKIRERSAPRQKAPQSQTGRPD